MIKWRVIFAFYWSAPSLLAAKTKSAEGDEGQSGQNSLEAGFLWIDNQI